MLNFLRLETLAAALGLKPEEISPPLASMAALVRHYLVYESDHPEKSPRDIYDPQGALRKLQKAIHKQLFLPNIERFPYSHGGVTGRSQLTHVSPHLHSQFVYTVDIEKFFPSIHYERVCGLFRDYGCSDEIARILTRACTYDYHLAQGFITSPFIADMIIRAVDERLASLAKRHGLKYTRFIDDITLSADFNLRESGVPQTIATILEGSGFRVSEKKRAKEDAAKEKCALNLRLTKPYPDVKADYYAETVRRLVDHAALGRGEKFDGPFFTSNQLYGRVRHILWVNRNRRHMLVPLWRALDWDKVIEEAKRRGILVYRKRFIFKRQWK